MAAGVALAAIVTYAPALNGGFVWDDHRLLETNGPELLSPGAWAHAFTKDYWYVADAAGHRAGGDHRLYRPLLKLVVIAEYRLFGADFTAGYHAISIALHALCGALVFLWLRRRMDARDGPALLAVLAGALLFVLHPSRAESVSWISGASDLWATLFVLIALEIWDRFRTPAGTAWATGFFLVALLFKEATAAAPLALAADALLLSSGEERRVRLRRAAVPIAAVMAGFALHLLIVPLHGGSALRNVGSRPARFLATVGQFARMSLWPFHPSTQVGYLPSSAFDERPVYPTAIVALGAVVLLGMLALITAAILWRPRWRPVVADLGWFWILALPALNVIPLAGIQYTGERFLYLPGIGLAALMARAGVAAVQRPVLIRSSLASAAAMLLLAFGSVARAHTHDFSDEITLWTSEHARDPGNGFVLEALYTAATQKGQYDLASKTAAEAVAVQPTPKGKAYMLVEWLRSEVERLRDDPTRLKQLRLEADALADGNRAGALGELASRVPDAGLDWLRTQPAFTVTRAWLALRTLDYEQAIALTEKCRSDSATSGMAWRIALLADVADGHWADADKLAADPHAPGNVGPVLKAQAQFIAEPGPAAWYARATTVYQLGDPSLARAVAVSLLGAFPRSEELMRLIITVDVNQHAYEEARRFIADHRAMLSEDWARQMLALIDQAERGSSF